MATRLTIKAFPYSELEGTSKPKAIAELKKAEVTDPTEILDSVFTKNGFYIPPAFLDEAA